MNVTGVPSDGTVERVELLLAPVEEPEDSSAVKGASITVAIVAIAQFVLFKL